jgi:hypothetical protein
MHVSGLAVPVRILAMVVSGGSVLRGFFVVVVISLLDRLAVLLHGSASSTTHASVLPL